MKLSLNEIYVLSSLSNGDQYGLGIIKEVKESGIELYLGGLYTILRRLEKQKLIKGYYKEETEDRAGNRRRYYKILAAGDQAFGEARSALMDLWGVKVSKASFFGELLAIFGIAFGLFLIVPILSAAFKLIKNIVVALVDLQISIILGGLLSKEELKEVGGAVNARNKKINSFFKKKLFSLRFLLPKKYREEIIGDLLEIKKELKQEGHGKTWTILLFLGQAISLVYHVLFFKVGEIYENKVKKEEDEEYETLALQTLEAPVFYNDTHPLKFSVLEIMAERRMTKLAAIQDMLSYKRILTRDEDAWLREELAKEQQRRKA